MKRQIKYLRMHPSWALPGAPNWRLAVTLLIALLPGMFPEGAFGQSEAPSPPAHRTAITNVTFVAFDVETTGFSPYTDRIVEIGAVKFRNGELLSATNWLVNPERPVPFQAYRVHNISDDMLKDQRPFPEVYPAFEAYIKDCVILAHNARFDVSFMAESLKRSEMELPANLVIDSLPVFRRWFPEAKSHSLEGLAFHLRISGDGFHRAAADSMFIFHILQKGLKTRSLGTLGELEKEAGRSGSLRF